METILHYPVNTLITAITSNIGINLAKEQSREKKIIEKTTHVQLTDRGITTHQ
jgi:hypothetical protein